MVGEVVMDMVGEVMDMIWEVMDIVGEMMDKAGEVQNPKFSCRPSWSVPKIPLSSAPSFPPQFFPP